jgi:formyl-CoA transferase
MAVPLIQYEGTGSAPARVGLRHPSIAPYGVFACGDGAQFLVSIQNPREWQRWAVDVLEAPELLDDPRFVDNTARVAHRAELDELITARLAMLSGETLQQRLELASIAYGQLNDVGDLGRHPHLRRLEVATAGGMVSVPAPPLVRPLGEAQLTVPVLGEHTDALRSEFP